MCECELSFINFFLKQSIFLFALLYYLYQIGALTGYSERVRLVVRTMAVAFVSVGCTMPGMFNINAVVLNKMVQSPT